MRVAMYIAVTIVIVSILVYFAFYFYKEKRNVFAENILKDAIVELKNFKVKNGDYPKSLDDLSIAEKAKQKIFFILPSSKIYYHKDNISFRLSYHIFPFGPFHGYDDRLGEWFYEE